VTGHAGGREPEFTFELRVCRWAERAWEPARDDSSVLVARQLGTRDRRWDTIVLECDPVGLETRACFGSERLDSDLLHVVRNAPRRWSWYREALPEPDYPWRYVREAVHRAADRGVVDSRKRDGRIELRRRWRYPDWVRRVIAVENKPDLDASAARALADQTERDVALGLADEVWVATRRTGESVEPALLERLPVEAGVLAFDLEGPALDTPEVVWHPRSLAVSSPGTRILDRPGTGEHDRSAARFEYVDPAWKAEKRLEITERAYERGWRSYADTMRPDCRHFELRDPAGPMPWCGAKDRSPTDRECSGSCPEFSPEPPAWRTRGWPIEGGPGKGQKRLLDRQRRRQRE
jgi:hypothetical protein